jgi:heptaprenyl diphosphate synthase
VVPLELVTFDDLDQRIKQHTYHNQLHRTNVGPHTSRFHFEVAKTILQTAQVSTRVGIDVLEALLLLQQGLSLHDRVEDELGLRRQLHVLAGDYCSGQYYRVLAGVANEELLMELCQAVMKVNEAKMTLYKVSASPSPNGYMDLLEVIEGELLLALAHHYFRDSSAWAPQIRSLVRAHIVKKEMVARRVPKYFTLRQAYDWLTDAMDGILHIQANAVLEPISSFITDYLRPTQKYIETQAYAEGNR